MDYRLEAKLGDMIKPDGWHLGELLLIGDEPMSGWKGCQFRVKTYNSAFVYPYGMPVNVEITGNAKYKSGATVSRCRIEFVKDGEPSEYSGGYIYHN